MSVMMTLPHDIDIVLCRQKILEVHVTEPCMLPVKASAFAAPASLEAPQLLQDLEVSNSIRPSTGCGRRDPSDSTSIYSGAPW